MKNCPICGLENEDNELFCTGCGQKFEEVIDETTEVSEEISDKTEMISDEAEVISDEAEEIADEVAEIMVPAKEPVKTSVKVTIAAIVAVLVAAIALYMFVPLGFLAKLGMPNSYGYINSVKARNISETEDSKKVKLGKAFDAFFTDGCSWSVEKTENGVDVICETKCTFDTAPNTTATYTVSYDFANRITAETFAAGEATLNAEQTASVLSKIARYSINPDYTSQDLSSSRYNNAEFYYPSGMTVEMFAMLYMQTTLEDFLATSGLPSDMEGTTDMGIAQNMMTLDGYAAMNNVPLEEVLTVNELDASTPGSTTLNEVINNYTVAQYFGVTDENLGEFREQFGFGEEVTLETKFGDIKDKVVKATFDMAKKQEEESSATPAPTPEATEATEAATEEVATAVPQQ